jgi:hypothetical protein
VSNYQLNDLSDFELSNLNAEHVTYRGRSALRLTQKDMDSNEECIAILRDSTFKNGMIETEIAGLPREGAFEGSTRVCGSCIPCHIKWKSVRILFHPSHQRARRRSTAAQSFHAVLFTSRVSVVQVARGKPGRVRVLYRSRRRRMDEDQDRCFGYPRRALCQRGGTAVPDCQ